MDAKGHVAKEHKVVGGVESSYYCLTIKPNVEMKIVDAVLEYGKWIEHPGASNEVGSPQGTIVKAGDSKKICSSGRAYSTSGTTGHVRLQSSDGKFVKIWWSVTFTGSLTQGSEQDQIFTVTNHLIKHQEYDWKIEAKTEATPKALESY